jgi:hypothetical protein
MPVRCDADALHLLTMVATDEPETLAFLLDGHGIGGVLVAVDNPVGPDGVLDVVELMTLVAEGVDELVSLVIASVRPHAGLLPGDIDRWLEASTRCEQRGIVLIEWYILGEYGPECPRDLLGEPPRWPQ